MKRLAFSAAIVIAAVSGGGAVADQLLVIPNQCLGNPNATGSNLGVYMVGTSDSNVSNNIFGWYNVSAANYGIVLGTASTRNHVTDNQMMNNCGAGGGAGACGAVVTIGGGVVGNWTNFNRP